MSQAVDLAALAEGTKETIRRSLAAYGPLAEAIADTAEVPDLDRSASGSAAFELTKISRSIAELAITRGDEPEFEPLRVLLPLLEALAASFALIALAPDWEAVRTAPLLSTRALDALATARVRDILAGRM